MPKWKVTQKRGFSEFLQTEAAAWHRKHFSSLHPLLPWVREPEGFADDRAHKDKVLQARLIAALGGKPSPILAWGLTPEEAIDVVGERGEGFIKPRRSGRAYGALCLVKEGSTYRHAISGEVRPREGWAQWLKEQDFKSITEMDRPWMVEETLRSPNGEPFPQNVKFYYFGTRLLLIQITDLCVDQFGRLSQTKFYRFNPQGKEISHEIERNRARENLRITNFISLDDLQRLRAVAEGIAAQYILPHIRVDLYDTSQGIVCGELDEFPGMTCSLSTKWDEICKEEWRRSAAELETRINSGQMDDLLAVYERVRKEAQECGLF